MKIPLVTECKRSHCELHFPQFSKINDKEHFESLSRCITDGNDPNSYFSTAYAKYGNVKEQVKIFEQAIKLPLRESCEFLYEELGKLRESGGNVYFETDYYRTKSTHSIVKFVPCCR